MTNGVAKLYDRLDPQERVAALLLAVVCDDEFESQRHIMATIDGIGSHVVC